MSKSVKWTLARKKTSFFFTYQIKKTKLNKTKKKNGVIRDPGANRLEAIAVLKFAVKVKSYSK